MQNYSILSFSGKTLGALALAVAACGSVNANAGPSGMSSDYMKSSYASKSGAFVKVGGAYNFADVETTGAIGVVVETTVTVPDTGVDEVWQLRKEEALLYSAYETKGSKFGFSGRVGYKFHVSSNLFLKASIGGSYLDIELDEDTSGNTITKSDRVIDMTYNYFYDAKLAVGVSLNKLGLFVTAGYGGLDYDLKVVDHMFASIPFTGTTVPASMVTNVTKSDTEYEFEFGAGISYDVTSNISIAAEYNQILFDIEDGAVMPLYTVTAVTAGSATPPVDTITATAVSRNNVEFKDGNVHQFIVSLEYTF